MTTIGIFKPPKNEEESGNLLAAHMPQGRAWAAKNSPGSILNGIIRGLSSDSLLVQQKIFELAQEFDIENTQNLLEEWEISVGIPDECVFVYSDIDDRRQRVIQRLRKIPVVTLAELQEYIDAFFIGYTVTLENASESSFFEYTFEMDFIGNTNNKFIIIAGISEGGDVQRLICLLRAIIPANVIIYTELPIFSFEEDPEGVGFGDDENPDVGGYFANI